MAKASGSTRNNRKVPNDKYLNDLFHSGNQYISGFLRGSYSESELSKIGLSESDVSEVTSYLDSVFQKAKMKEGSVERNMGFKTEKELNDFIYKTINFADNTYRDRGYSFVSEGKAESIYGGGSQHYTVTVKYKNAKYLDFGTLQKGYTKVGVINRNQAFLIDDIKSKQEGKHIEIILRRK